jgi:hypothetical protein
MSIPLYIWECIELLGGRNNLTYCWRYETGQFMGIFLQGKFRVYLPTDKTRREIIKLLNNYAINTDSRAANHENDILL